MWWGFYKPRLGSLSQQSPAGSQELPQIGVNAEVSWGLPSKQLTDWHALIVQIIIGLRQANFKDLNLLKNVTFTKENFLNELLISNHTNLISLRSQSEIKRKWILDWYLLISGRSKPPTEDESGKVINLICAFFFFDHIKELSLNFMMVFMCEFYQNHLDGAK